MTNAIDTLNEALALAQNSEGKRDRAWDALADVERRLEAFEALLQAAEGHLRHTDQFCTDRDDEADLTCPTHKALAAAVRDVKGEND